MRKGIILKNGELIDLRKMKSTLINLKYNKELNDYRIILNINNTSVMIRLHSGYDGDDNIYAYFNKFSIAYKGTLDLYTGYDFSRHISVTIEGILTMFEMINLEINIRSRKSFKWKGCRETFNIFKLHNVTPDIKDFKYVNWYQLKSTYKYFPIGRFRELVRTHISNVTLEEFVYHVDGVEHSVVDLTHFYNDISKDKIIDTFLINHMGDRGDPGNGEFLLKLIGL